MRIFTDKELLDEIKIRWVDVFEFEQSLDGRRTHNADYLADEIEEYILSLETDYKNRGRKLPDRQEYISRFEPTERNSQ